MIMYTHCAAHICMLIAFIDSLTNLQIKKKLDIANSTPTTAHT